jgi:threonine dehydrogenase-like Zn-dependent dehydrogenase
VGVHAKPVELHMERLWDRNTSVTTRLADTVTTAMLLKVVRSGKLQPSKLVTHRFAMHDIMKAYDTFGNAAQEDHSKWFLRMASLVDEMAEGGEVRISWRTDVSGVTPCERLEGE